MDGRPRPGAGRCAAVTIVAVWIALGSAGLAFAATGVAPATGPRLVRLTGVPARFAGSLTFSLSTRNTSSTTRRLVLSGWLASNGKLLAVGLSRRSESIPAHQSNTLSLTMTASAHVPSGSYQLVVCRSGRTRCVTSEPFSYVAPARLIIGRRPLSVMPSLDGAHAASATIGSAGGTIATTTASGSRLVLSIARGALADDELVSVTPVLALSGAGAALVAGAQIAPAGLVPHRPVTLTITPRRPVPRSQLLAFGYQNGGAQFGLVPSAPGHAFQIPVIQFGGVGLARAGASQRAAVGRRPPSDRDGALLEQIAGPQSLAAIAGAYASIQRRLAGSASGTVGDYLSAVAEATIWSREASEWGAGFFADKQQLLRYVELATLPRFWTATLAACGTGAETVGALRDVLVLARESSILGGANLIGGAAGISAARAGCGQPDLAVSLLAPDASWQAPAPSPLIASAIQVAVTIPATPLTFQNWQGDHQVSFQTARVAPAETMLSFTESPQYQTQNCALTFDSFSANPSLAYASFLATLTLSTDLFTGGTSGHWTLGVSAAGADMASFDANCQSAGTFTYPQSPSALAGIGRATATAPAQLTQSNPVGAFSGSGNVSATSGADGTYTVSGTISVTLPG